METAILELPDKITVQVLYWETNFNKKLGCDAMIHIDLAPTQTPSWSKMESKIFEIRTKDNSSEPVLYRLMDVLTFRFEEICWQQSYPSHGMSTVDLANFFFERYSTYFKWSTKVAVYFYLKYESTDTV